MGYSRTLAGFKQAHPKRAANALPAAQPGPVAALNGASLSRPASLPKAYAYPARPQRKSKYKAKRTQVNGIWFMSKAEAKRYAELDILFKGGVIRHLILQPRYSLTTHGVKIGDYVADFEYEEMEHNPWVDSQVGWRKVAEDVKGFATDLFKWKAKHFRAEYKAIELREVKA